MERAARRLTRGDTVIGAFRERIVDHIDVNTIGDAVTVYWDDGTATGYPLGAVVEIK